jgi:hypothetical protein
LRFNFSPMETLTMTVTRASTLRRTLAAALIVSMSFLGVSMPAQAGVIGTEAVVQAQSQTESMSAGRVRLAAALGRSGVVQILQSRGVDPEAAKARIATLSDSEAANLAQQIDDAPAGGINLLAGVALVFVVLVITDILGFTKIFSFTSPIK